jgi:hypothetical protein
MPMHSSENKGLCRSALVKHPNLFHIFGEIFAYVPPTQSSDRASLNFFNRTIPAQSTSLWPAFWLLGSNCQNANKFSGDTGFGGCPNLGQSSYTEIDMVECYGSGWCQFHIANPSFGIGNGCDATYAVLTCRQGAASTSQIARLYLSPVGAVSLMVTLVPLNGVDAF